MFKRNNNHLAVFIKNISVKQMNISKIILIYIYLIIAFACVYHSTHLEVREHLVRVSSLYNVSPQAQT